MFYYYYSTTYCTYLMECVSLKKPTSFSVIIIIYCIIISRSCVDIRLQ